MMRVDPEDQRRTLALQDAVDMTRHAASAVAAATHGEQDAFKEAVLEGIQQRLCSLLAQCRRLDVT